MIWFDRGIGWKMRQILQEDHVYNIQDFDSCSEQYTKSSQFWKEKQYSLQKLFSCSVTNKTIGVDGQTAKPLYKYSSQEMLVTWGKQ